jgi:hypothetical protein
MIYPKAYKIVQSIIRSWKVNKGKEKPLAKKKLKLDYVIYFQNKLENNFPFRTIQLYIQYKSLLNSSPVFFVNPKKYF